MSNSITQSNFVLITFLYLYTKNGAECEDKYDHCAWWVREGHCGTGAGMKDENDNYIGSLEEVCAKSCKYCGGK